MISALSFTVPWFISAQLIGCELPNIIGSIISLICMIAASRFFNKEPDEEYAITLTEEDRGTGFTVAEGVKAWSPFILIFFLLMFTSTLCPPIHNLIADIKTSAVFYAGEGGSTLTFSWINTPGVMIFIAAVIGGLIQKATVGDMLGVLLDTLKKYWKTILTICSVMATAKIMGYSGMISDIANVLVIVAGPFYPFISPFIGALGAFVTGSGTSTCVLFGGTAESDSNLTGTQSILDGGGQCHGSRYRKDDLSAVYRHRCRRDQCRWLGKPDLTVRI